jgi:hypothetical protein
MTWIEAKCMFYGSAFSPAKVEELTNIVFAEKNELGELGTRGRYIGLSTPYGSSTLYPPLQMTKENADYGIEWLINTIIKERVNFESAGATDVTLSLAVYHDGQCNLEFSASLLKRIAESAVNVILSCYEDVDYVQKKLGKN